MSLLGPRSRNVAKLTAVLRIIFQQDNPHDAEAVVLDLVQPLAATALSRQARPPPCEAVRAGGSTARSPLIGHREPLSLPKTQSIRGQQRIRT
jgi:anti-sigma factor ChrR (cupin superfamily)